VESVDDCASVPVVDALELSEVAVVDESSAVEDDFVAVDFSVLASDEDADLLDFSAFFDTTVFVSLTRC
jgi:hypothetical protein